MSGKGSFRAFPRISPPVLSDREDRCERVISRNPWISFYTKADRLAFPCNDKLARWSDNGGRACPPLFWKNDLKAYCTGGIWSFESASSVSDCVPDPDDMHFLVHEKRSGK